MRSTWDGKNFLLKQAPKEQILYMKAAHFKFKLPHHGSEGAKDNMLFH